MLKHINLFVNELLNHASPDEEEGWSEPVDMTPHCKFLAFDIVSDFAFGQSLGLQTKEENRGLILGMRPGSILSGIYAQYPGLSRYGLSRFLKFKGAWTQEKFGKFMKGLVQARLEIVKDAKHDLFSFIIDAPNAGAGQAFTLDELWSESRLFMFAGKVQLHTCDPSRSLLEIIGTDTTASVLAGTLFYLSRYPTCYDKVASEVRGGFHDSSEICSGPRLAQCSYLRAVLDETMRMTPPVGAALWREVCEAGVVIDGHPIPRGTDIGTSLYSLFHSEKIFPDASTYIPERWLNSTEKHSEQTRQARKAFNPFSLGARRCVGQNMAYLELTLTLAKLLWHLDFRRPSGTTNTEGAGQVNVSAGRPGGRHNLDEFQISEHLTPMHDGPLLELRPRCDIAKDCLSAISEG